MPNPDVVATDRGHDHARRRWVRRTVAGLAGLVVVVAVALYLACVWQPAPARIPAARVEPVPVASPDR